MKKQTHSTLLPVVAATTGIGLLPILFCPATTPEKAQSGQKQAVEALPKPVELIAGYRTWTKVNPDPYQMNYVVSMRCIGPTPEEVERTRTSPHYQKYATIYVNKIGKMAMLQQSRPHFPVGTVIVKEKLSQPNGRSPELMTVMVKRDKGFNPKCGDWEYLVINGTGTKVEAQGKLEQCQSCHHEEMDTDYVFRNYYLPAKLQSALK